MKWFRDDRLLPFSWYRQMRQHAPLRFQPEANRWSVFSYAEAKQALTRYSEFSSRMRDQPPTDEPIEATVLRRDPPDHRRLRALVSQAFTPQAIEALAPTVARAADELLMAATARGRFDFAREVAVPLPIAVIAHMLGIPSADREQFKSWSDDLTGTDRLRFRQCQLEMSDYFRDIAAERRMRPGHDLISRLVHLPANDVHLSETELIGFCILLLVAGNETTTHLLTSLLLCLDSEPEWMARLRQHRELVPHAIEETLRFSSPVQSMERRCVRDAELGGQLIRAGQLVRIYIGSANHDEAMFEQPDRLRLDRPANPHLAFGSGIHFCLGATLARLEAATLLHLWLDRVDEFRIDAEPPLAKQDSHFIFGVTKLPVRCSPRTRRNCNEQVQNFGSRG